VKVELEGVQARHPAAARDAPYALGPLTLGVMPGEHVAIIGPSGAGKTTLLQVLACSLPPAVGRVALDGQDPWQLTRPALQRLRGRLFLAPQVPPLPPRQRVVTAVLAGRLPAWSVMASLRSLFYPSDIPGARAALQRFDLDDKVFHRVDRLSGGERQRVGLSRALTSPASLWLVDEPLSALDPTRAQQAMLTLVGAARETQRTLVTTLHQVDMALTHFPRVVGLRAGTKVFDLPSAAVTRDLLKQLYAQHEHELDGPAEVGVLDEPITPSPPAVMHCR
jgi:phosphonate transport system ATP-binding protein